jgi:hypothetical protein
VPDVTWWNPRKERRMLFGTQNEERNQKPAVVPKKQKKTKNTKQQVTRSNRKISNLRF